MRISWILASLLVLGFFIILPDEGTATTRRQESLSLNFTKIEFGYEADKRQSGGGTVAVTDVHLAPPSGFVGPIGGASLPISSDSEVFSPDSFGMATAGAQNVYFTGAPGALPPLTSYHTSMDFTVPGTLARGESGIISVQHDPATSPDKSYWQASVDIAMPGATANSFTFFVEANPDQPGLSLKSVQTSQGSLNFTPGFSSFFDVFVELDFDPLAGPIDTSKPIIWITTTGTPEPASATALLCAGLGLLRRARR